MRFYELQTEDGQTVGCDTSLVLVRERIRSYGHLVPGDTAKMTIIQQEVTVNADTVRRLIGQLGGIASDISYWTARMDKRGRAIITPDVFEVASDFTL